MALPGDRARVLGFVSFAWVLGSGRRVWIWSMGLRVQGIGRRDAPKQR